MFKQTDQVIIRLHNLIISRSTNYGTRQTIKSLKQAAD